MFILFTISIILVTSRFFIGTQCASYTVNVKDQTVTKEILSCDTDPKLHFSCYDGMVLKFVSAHYGRYDLAEQAVFKSRGQYDKFEYNVDALDILKDHCDYMQNCYIPSSYSVNQYFFGALSKCPMGSRYLKTYFKCIPKHLAVCESDDVTIACPHGTKIKVYNSYYGRKKGSKTCYAPGVEDKDCYVTNPPSVMNCVGKINCRIYSNNAAAGSDPCHGSRKYTYVDYTCEV